MPTSCGASAFAPTPTPREDAARRASFGAEGIGLCRTEHMFFGEDRERAGAGDVHRRRELAPGADPRRAERGAGRQRSSCRRGESAPVAGASWRAAAARLRGDPARDARAAGDDPAARPAASRVPAAASTSRIGSRDAGGGRRAIASASARSARRRSSRDLQEANPMLGTRGIRLGILFPQIYEMQVRALIGAAPKPPGPGTRPASRSCCRWSPTRPSWSPAGGGRDGGRRSDAARPGPRSPIRSGR